MQNAFYQKHSASSTTTENIRNLAFRLIKELKDNKKAIKAIGDIDLNSIATLSGQTLLQNIEENYRLFFETSESKDSQIYHEIKTIINFCYSLLKTVNESPLSEAILEEALRKHQLNNSLMKNIDIFENDVFIDTRSIGVIGFIFSLNITIYMVACFEISLERDKNQSISEEILLELSHDCKKNECKSAFHYYIYFWKKETNKSDEKMAEYLGVDIRTFYRYKKGYKIKKISLFEKILNNNPLYYILSSFWLKIIELTKSSPEEFHEKYNNYKILAKTRVESN